MSHSGLKFLQASVAMRVRSKLHSRAHKVPCLGFHSFISLLSFQPSAPASLIVILLKWPSWFPPQDLCPCCSLWGSFPKITVLVETVTSDLTTNATSQGHCLTPSNSAFRGQEQHSKYVSLEKMFWGNGKSRKVVPKYEPRVHLKVRCHVHHNRNISLDCLQCFSGLFASF